MMGYVFDELAVIAGLTNRGTEHQRREFSRLVDGAIDGGPTIDVPALCLAAATGVRPAIADHLAEIIASSPPETMKVSEFLRAEHLEVLSDHRSALGWPGVHAAARAMRVGHTIITADPERYEGLAVDVIEL